MSSWIDRFSLNGRTALVTGASRGIGAEICRVYADAGADIVAVARDEKELEKVAADVQALGRQCHVYVCDLMQPESIALLCKKVLEDRQVDILVNNAGVGLVAPALEATLEDWDTTMAINVRAPFQLATLLAPGMIERRWGKIINVSSQAGVVAIEDHVAYSSSKAAMNALTRGLMSEWARHNIQVNAICPTVILTDMGKRVWGAKEMSEPMIAKIPLRRFGEQVEVADMALYLASDAAALVNGETLLLDGGFSAV
jgi:NAD(P)-dependent dehydrogenase (short-subunit alcohol dehydrogenase family)